MELKIKHATELRAIKERAVTENTAALHAVCTGVVEIIIKGMEEMVVLLRKSEPRTYGFYVKHHFNDIRDMLADVSDDNKVIFERIKDLHEWETDVLPTILFILNGFGYDAEGVTDCSWTIYIKF